MYAMRRDQNERDIVAYLEVHGFQAEPVNGCPFDLIVWREGGRGFLLLECKSRDGRLTPRQKAFFARTQGLPRVAVRTPEAALEAAQVYAGFKA